MRCDVKSWFYNPLGDTSVGVLVNRYFQYYMGPAPCRTNSTKKYVPKFWSVAIYFCDNFTQKYQVLQNSLFDGP